MTNIMFSRLRTKERASKVHRYELDRDTSKEQRQGLVRTIRLHPLAGAIQEISNDLKRAMRRFTPVLIASKCVIESAASGVRCEDGVLSDVDHAWLEDKWHHELLRDVKSRRPYE